MMTFNKSLGVCGLIPLLLAGGCIAPIVPGEQEGTTGSVTDGHEGPGHPRPDTPATTGDTDSGPGVTSAATSGANDTDGCASLQVHENLGSVLGQGVLVGTNIGAGDHLDNLCGEPPWGSSDTGYASVGGEGEGGGWTDTSAGWSTGIIGDWTTGEVPQPPPTTTTTHGDTDGVTTSGGPYGTTTWNDTWNDTWVDTDGEPTGGGVYTGEEYLVGWTAPSSGSYRFDLNGSNYDTFLGIFGDCGQSLGCNDDCQDLMSGIAIELAAGQSIVLAIGGFSGASGNFVLNIDTGNDGMCGTYDTGRPEDSWAPSDTWTGG